MTDATLSSTKVAVVTGATRGAGRAIAQALGGLGMTVYVTGRSTRGSASGGTAGGTAGGTRTDGMPGTVEDTADEVAAAGGRGIPAVCDATDDGQVRALFERVHSEQGRLDVLVNNAWPGYEGAAFDSPFDAPFWEQPLDLRWEAMFVGAVRANFVANQAAAPLLIASAGGLVVHTIAWAFDAYLGALFYDVAKAAIARMAFGMAQELRPHGVAVVALASGFMRTERVLAHHAKAPFDLSPTESPDYVARAVAALAGDPAVIEKTGRTLTAGELAREYGFTDSDGSTPPPFRID